MNDTVREWVAKAQADYPTAARENAVADDPNYDVIASFVSNASRNW
jgi:hypothetical protein